MRRKTEWLPYRRGSSSTEPLSITNSGTAHTAPMSSQTASVPTVVERASSAAAFGATEWIVTTPTMAIARSQEIHAVDSVAVGALAVVTRRT